VALTGPNRRQETTPSASHDAPPAPYPDSALELVLARVLVRRLLPAMVKRCRARRFCCGGLVSCDNVLSKRRLYSPSSNARPKAFPTMERKSPMLVISPWSCKALRNSPSTRFRLRLRSLFLRSLAHILAQRLRNFCCNLTGAAAESTATTATLEDGSPGL